ncbi:50S ribosomal protein L19 [Plasmodium vivax North Korean]|uniref:50S ribosomal protein L19, chloroplastic n=1 Tax=Plasmodium vivax North Korean TaxID=1035514 RepID=A0A0J9TKP7_PLAVI|nr:50S ribosomal protein L19 [Plasmodium vivax North Korean]
MQEIDVKKLFYDMQGNKEKSETFKILRSGDIVNVYECILDEKKKERIQKFEGILVRKKGSLLGENILVREKLKNY